jgi:GAF domain-containing protein
MNSSDSEITITPDPQVLHVLTYLEMQPINSLCELIDTLALTQNLRMDAVLDTLLQTLSHIVPYDAASVILTEENERLFVAREAPPASANRPVVTLEVGDNALLQRVLVLKKGLHLADTREESEWREHKALAGVRSWIAVPLVASDTVLGLFSIGSKLPRVFTTEHFRLAKLLAIPAAVAIHNARLYEWAQTHQNTESLVPSQAHLRNRFWRSRRVTKSAKSAR